MSQQQKQLSEQKKQENEYEPEYLPGFGATVGVVTDSEPVSALGEMPVFRSIEILPAPPALQRSVETDQYGLDNACLEEAPMACGQSLLVDSMLFGPVADAPCWISQTSFLSDSFPRDILVALGTELTHEENVDFQLVPELNQIQAVMYSNHESIEFNVTVYKKSDQYLVEFHRVTGGGAWGFMHMYRRVVRAASHLCSSHEDVPSEQDHKTEASFAMALDKSDDVSAWTPLLDMASSPYIDCACKGLCALAQIASTADNAQALAVKAKDVVSACVKALEMPHDMPRRLAATLLANLAQYDTSVRDELTQLPLLARVLCATSNPEAERQLARLLNYMSRTHGGRFEAQTLQNMEQACAKADARAQSLLYSALGNVHEHVSVV